VIVIVGRVKLDAGDATVGVDEACVRIDDAWQARA
jgi:hypothetical protein